LARRGSYRADDIAFASLPQAAFYAVVSLLGGPQAEAIVMLGHHHNIFRTRCLDGAHPLFRIKLRGIEDLRIGSAITPLVILKRVGAKMNNCPDFEILPLNLWRGRFNVHEVLRGRSATTQQNGGEHGWCFRQEVSELRRAHGAFPK